MDKYENIGSLIGALVDKKNFVDDDSFSKAGDILALMFPKGVPVEKYTDMLAIVCVLGNLIRIADAKRTSADDPWMNVAACGILMSKEIAIPDSLFDGGDIKA